MSVAFFLLFAAISLAVPVTSCLLVLQAKQDGQAIAPAICAVATAWTVVSISIMPPLRGLVISVDAISSFWVVVPVAVSYLTLMFLLVLVPRWIAKACPWQENAVPDIDQWLTFVTRTIVAFLSLVSLVTLLLVFGQWIIELSKAGMIFYLVRPDVPVVSATNILYKAAQVSIEAFWTNPGQVFLDSANIPGLPFSILTLTICFSVNVAIALADQPLVEDEDQTT